MHTHPSFSVDDAIALLFPEDITAFQKNKFPAFNEDVDSSYLAVIPSGLSDPPNNDFFFLDDDESLMITKPCRQACETHMSSPDSSDVDAASQECSSSPAQKEKKRLIAWTPEEHERFVVALERLRTEDTESYNRHGKKTMGLGPGIAEVIAVAVRTRTAAQVRSHAQKYFTRQRKESDRC